MFVFNSVVDTFIMATDEWLLIILMTLDDYYQFIFGNVIEILTIESIFCASGVLIIVSLFLLFCNNITLCIISTTTTPTTTVYFAFFYFVTSTIIFNVHD